ncbi:MAG: isocitrate lyase/phosphoenolpyruvate mutase family protein [Idiomarina sp.]
MTFKSLHHRQQPLVLANVWDVQSAIVAERQGFAALGTSSAAISAVNGLADGGNLTPEYILKLAQSILTNVDIPLSVDIEHGYFTNAKAIAEFVVELARVGVQGINIEDSTVSDGTRSLRSITEFSAMLHCIQHQLKRHQLDIFLNARIDTYLVETKNVEVETAKRVVAYENSGADGLFIPLLPLEQAKAVKALSSLPLNLLCNTENYADTVPYLRYVNRVSFGNYLYDHAMAAYRGSLKDITAFFNNNQLG